ncbi:MAG: hypothetical protein IJS74_00500 [Clostridia bacterium]|nr:hypothetical protein [Clostridia bacterium]
MEEMKKEEVLEVASKKKAVVGEAEKQKVNAGNWIALIVAGALAVVLMIVEGALGHFTSIYVLGMVCFTWASVLYFMQYFKAKRPWQVLIGAVLEAVGAIAMLVCYILYNVGVI